MVVYGLVVLLVGVTLLSSAVALAMSLHRRWRLPYALLSVGMLTYLLALFVQAGLLRLTRGTILGVWPIRVITLGLIIGFTEETARLFGYQYLARGVVTKRQAVFIGLGHGFTVTIYTGVLALVLGLSLLGRASSDNLGALLSGAAAEALNSILPVLMHMALSWLVLLVFLRGELGWLFLAVFIHSTVEGTAAWIGPADSWAVVIWRAVIAGMSVILLRRLRIPG